MATNISRRLCKPLLCNCSITICFTSNCFIFIYLMFISIYLSIVFSLNLFPTELPVDFPQFIWENKWRMLIRVGSRETSKKWFFYPRRISRVSCVFKVWRSFAYARFSFDSKPGAFCTRRGKNRQDSLRPLQTGWAHWPPEEGPLYLQYYLQSKEFKIKETNA